ncbi:MAG: hypothetical protein J2P41_02230 [Blastocatellia bacterium]|nr:hypothetical protein [Blastocatellia bacterium]
MKCSRACLIVLFLLVLTGFATAQQTDKIKRPVKFPPQYPNIIDLENKGQNPQGNTQEQRAGAGQADSLEQSLASLTNEVKTLVREIRELNLRQEAQLDILRMTRMDLRIDHYESELRPVRERIAALETEEQNLLQLMTRDALLAQTANIGTLNREQAMQQVKLNHETRLSYVVAEKERVRKVESELAASLNVYQNLSKEAEKKIQAAEEMLQQTDENRVERKP